MPPTPGLGFNLVLSLIPMQAVALRLSARPPAMKGQLVETVLRVMPLLPLVQIHFVAFVFYKHRQEGAVDFYVASIIAWCVLGWRGVLAVAVLQGTATTCLLSP